MRILITALGLGLLAGCVSPTDLEESGPAFEVSTNKSPRNFSRCLTPKWQALNSRVASTETEYGYRIRLDIDMVGTPVMAIVEEKVGGAKVRVYIRNSTWSEWTTAAQSCI